jgi:Uma2 family endonuclease
MTAIQTVNIPTEGPSPQELLRAEREGGVEFVHGQLVEKPVSRISDFVARRISSLMGFDADKTGIAWVFQSSMGYQCFPDDPRKFRKPDVSVVRSDRIAALGTETDHGLLPIPADLAVEVNSPTDGISDVLEKVEEYLGAGFPLVWVVDPPTKTVTIYRADGSTTKLREKDEITGELALPAFKCKVAEFFVMPPS